MNADKMLNRCICKFNLDEDYPQFRKMLCAKELILDWMNEIVKENKKVLCIGINKDDINYFSFLSKKYSNNISYIEFNSKQIDKKQVEGYDAIWVISLKAVYLTYWLANQSISYIEIYDELQKMVWSLRLNVIDL